MIKTILIIAAALRLAGATTVTLSVPPTATQAVLAVDTDQPGNCTYRASEGSVFGVLVNDINPTLFANSNSDARPGSIVRGRLRKFVLGSRVTQVSPFDQRRYSRALQAFTPHIVGVTCGSDAEKTLTFTTANPDSGITYQEPRFDRAYPGQWAYPSLDWTSRTKEYADPSTGVAVKLATLPGDLMPITSSGLGFPSTIPNVTGWTCVLQACDYSGTSQTKLLLQANAIAPGLVANALQAGNANSAQLVVRLSGTAGAVLVCLTVDTVTCAGGQISQAITGTPTTYTIGSTAPVMESWRNGPEPPVSAEMMRTKTITVTKTGTSLARTGGDYFPYYWGSSGVKVVIDGSPCRLTMTSDIAATVSSCAAADGARTVTADTFGFLLQASTAANVTIALGASPAPAWTLQSSGIAVMPSTGFLTTCSPVTFVRSGVNGNLCGFAFGYGPPFTYNTCNPIFWIGQDGTTNLIGLSCAPTPAGLNNGVNGSEGMVWDGVTAGRFYAIGTKTGGVVNNAVYRVDYTGNASAATPAHDSQLPSSSSAVETDNINTLVSAFDTAGNFASYLAAYPNTGWKVISWTPSGTRGALLMDTRIPNQGQNSPGWQVIFGLDTGNVIAAKSTYAGASGQPNRWGGIHSGFALTQYPWTLYTIDPTDVSYTTTSAGTLSAGPWSTCPANPFGVTGANCSMLTVGSVTPLANGVSLMGQTILAGDSIQVNQECVRVMTIAGATIVVQRNQRLELIDFGLCGGSTSHSPNQTLRMMPSLPLLEEWWNFPNDPHGTDTTRTYLFGETVGLDGHYGYNSDTALLGFIAPTIPSGVGKQVRLGAMPANVSATPFSVNFNAPFATATASGGDNFNETHPSNSQVSASTTEQQHFLDNRPFMGFGVPSGGVTQIGTYVYKVPAAALPSLNYRVRNWLVQSNNRIAVDKSAPAAISMLLDTSADWHKYCYVLIAGECFAGSSPGETYVNLPYVSSLLSVPTRFAAPRNDIDISEWQHSNQSLVELDTSRGADPNGAGVRVLTSAFAPTRPQYLGVVFWNSREVPLGKWIYTFINDLNAGQQQGVLIKKPPAPTRTSINHADYIRIPFSLSGVSGDQVRIRFGFGEYDQGQLATGAVPPCHTRNEGCFTDGIGTQPYLWTAETQHPTACNSGCTVTLKVPPAPGGRVVYYQVVRSNGANTVTGPMEVLIAR